MNDFESALREAQKRRCLVWLHWDAPWSAEARAWREKILSAPCIVDLQKQFVFISRACDSDPALDAAFQYGMQNMGGRCGWPLNLFFSPKGTWIFGATSPEEKDFSELLRQLVVAWELE